MSNGTDRQHFPRGALVGAAALVGFVLLFTSAARVTGIGTSRLPDATPVESREVRFEDRPDGRVAVLEGDERRLVDVLEPGTNGFVRSVMRGLARERKLQGIGPAPPFRLVRSADGLVLLEDPATGRRIDLVAFGPTNMAAFGRLLPTSDPTP